MKIKYKSTQECSGCFEIEVPPETIAKAFEEVYEELSKVANIPGFRQGRAPKELVKKHYSKDARDEVLKKLIPDAYRYALDKHRIVPIGLPEISDVTFVEENVLSFKAKVDTRPQFELKDYKGIKAEKKKVDIKDEDVEKTLDNLREVNARYNAVDRPVEMDDFTVADLECFVDGKSIHKKRENIWLSINKDAVIPGLSEKIAGMKKGEEKEIEVVLPEKYPDKSLAGKTAVYKVLVKEIKVRQLPAIDDEFAKDLGKENLIQLKDAIRKELIAHAEYQSAVETENKILGRLIDDNVFVVPSSFINRQLDYMVENAKRKLEEKGFKRQELDKKDEEFRAKFKDDAVKQVRLLFILDEIARTEKIEVAAEDLDKAYEEMAARSGRSISEVKEYYAKEELEDSLRDKIREGKVIEFLRKNAEIIET